MSQEESNRANAQAALSSKQCAHVPLLAAGAGQIAREVTPCPSCEIERLRAVARALTNAMRNVNIERHEWYTHIAQPLQDVYQALGSPPELALTPEEIKALAGSAPETGGRLTLDTDRQVFFYEQEFYVLSNFSAFMLHCNGMMFPTSEHAYHWDKFPDDPLKQRAIQVASSAHEAFKLAERWKQYRRPDWDDVKVGIMRGILRLKAEQHVYVRRKLLETGDRELIEQSWRDDFWGWGPNRTGQNMLGKLWMEIRAELRQVEAGALPGVLVGYFYNASPGAPACCTGQARRGAGLDEPPAVCQHGNPIHWET